MKRSPMKRAKPRKRKASDPTKRLGKSAVAKGPARDPEHLARVRQHGCIAWEGSIRLVTARIAMSQAHHVRCIGPRTLGKRVSDYLTVPLCPGCHAQLHEGNEAEFWKRRKVDPAAWIAKFSPEGAAEIARRTTGDKP